MNIQYNFETLKNCARENLACFEKEHVLHPNFEELIETIRTFKKLQTHIALMHSNSTLNSIIKYHSDTNQ